MSKEKRCDCCKQYWYVDDLVSGLCPNCVDYFALKNKINIEQDQKIKELEHRLSNCIEPKFKIGQEVYMIDSTRVEITGYKIINFDKPHTLYRIKDDELTFGNIPENEVFATEEEAKAMLEELENE